MTAARVVRLLGLIAVAIAATAELPPQWKNWRYSMSIDPGLTEAERYINVTVPASVMSHAQPGLPDLRVIDSSGREVPYALSARLGGRTRDGREAKLLEPSVVPGQYSQALFDLGKGARVHNAVTLGIEGQDDLLTWVEVAVSDDHEHWRVVRERAPIYRLLQAGLEARTTVSYPDSVARYLRVRILDGSRPYHIVSGTVVHEVATEAERVPAGITLSSAPSTSASSSVGSASVWTADTAQIPISEVRFDSSQKSFYRPVSVEVSEDGSQWTSVASGEIYRTVERGQPRESLSVEFPEHTGAHWRVTVHNRNDAPLEGVAAALYMTPRHVIVRQAPGQQYSLIYGNSRTTAPQYDMARLIDPNVVNSATLATLGGETENSAYANPAPWTEQHQMVMWIALGVAVLVLGALAVRSLVGGKGSA